MGLQKLGFNQNIGGTSPKIISYPLQAVNTRQRTERLAKKKKGPNSSPPTPAVGSFIQIYQVLIKEGIGGLYSGLKPSLLGTAASQGVYYYFYQILKNKALAIAIANKRKGRGNGSVGKFSCLVVAALAGCLNVLLTAPIWILVTRMQTHTQAERKILEAKRETLLKEVSESRLSASLQEKLAEIDSMKLKPYGAFDAVSEVYNESGISGFWKGTLPALIMFMIYETSLKYLKTKSSQAVKVSALEAFILGAMTKLGATVITYPLLVVRARLQAKQEIASNVSQRYSGTLDAIVKMIRHEGLRSFYKGMNTKIVQSVLAASVLFMIKEELVKAFSALLHRRQKTKTANFDQLRFTGVTKSNLGYKA